MDDLHPPPTTGWIEAIFLIFLLLLSMFFSASETAFLCVNKLKVRYLKHKKDKKAIRVDAILRDKQKFLTTSLISNTLVNSLVTVLLTSIAIKIFKDDAVKFAVPVATALVLIFGEIVPKTVALVYPETITLHASLITSILMKILQPFVYIFAILTKPFLILTGLSNKKHNSNVTGEDLKTFFETSEQAGYIKPDESKMMEKILNYESISAKSIMTPRTKIEACHISTSIQEALKLSCQSHFSRLPIYEKDIDDIKGIFYVKDFLFSDYFFNEFNDSTINEKQVNITLKDLMREPIFVFEGSNAGLLQQYFYSNSQSMLIIIDEYGGTSGILTTEDLTEEIFGDIEDEYDINQTDTKITILKDGAIVPGIMQINDVNETIDSNFKSELHETIAGLMLEIIGDIPIIGQKAKIDGYDFTVLAVKNNQITKLKVSLLNTEIE